MIAGGNDDQHNHLSWPVRLRLYRDQTLGRRTEAIGDNAFLICHPFALDEVVPELRSGVEEELTSHFERFGGESSSEEVSRLAELGKEKKSKVVVGLDGGKTQDTAKAVAHELELPVAIVPTIASTNAPCSALSVIYTPEGEVERYLFCRTIPNWCWLTLGSPLRLLCGF